MRGNFDPAFPTSGTEVVQGSGIVERATVYVEMIVVETLIQWPSRSAGPSAVVAFRELGSAATAEVHRDALSLGRLDAKPRVALRVALRILLAGLVQARGFKVFLDRRLVCLCHRCLGGQECKT